MRLAFVSLLLMSVFLTATPSLAADMATGIIKSYECGDNCYLTITKNDGEELTALCAADACTPWNEQAAIPDDMIGKTVEVTITSGKQYDGAGNEMGEFPSFSKVVVGTK